MTNNEYIVILCDGAFPKNKYLLELIDNAAEIVCCDASILKLLKYRNVEDLQSVHIVGDMDTLSPSDQNKFSQYITKICDQETNDQTKAFHYALSRNFTKIFILGISGGREDHTIGNISLLSDYKQEVASKEIEIVAFTDYGIFYPILNSSTFKCEPKSQVSIFAFDSTLKVKSDGLKYPTDNVIFDMWWKATLNESIGETFSLTFSHPAKVLVYITFKEKLYLKV
jgi:thiamine pyrophosphokinase